MIIFLYGEDTFRSRQKLKELKDKFRREVDPEGSSLVTIDGENAGLGKVNEAVASSSLFSRKRLVVVENIFTNKSKTAQDEICEYLKNRKKEENIIIFWDETTGEKMGKNKLFNFLNKKALLAKDKFVQNFPTLSNTEVINWIKEEVKARGSHISQKGAYELAGLVGNNLWQLHNEIDKLISCKKGFAPALIKDSQVVEIDERDVQSQVRGKADENIFALTDAISGRNKGLALSLFEQELAAGVPDAYLMHMIIRQFKILLQVRVSLDQGHTSRKIINDLKLHPFIVQKSMSQVRNFSVDALKKIFKELLLIDKNIKSGQADLKSSIGLLITRI